jgi:hypothetical protein
LAQALSMQRTLDAAMGLQGVEGAPANAAVGLHGVEGAPAAAVPVAMEVVPGGVIAAVEQPAVAAPVAMEVGQF